MLRRSRCRVDHDGHGQAILGPALLEIANLPIPLGVFLEENRSLINHIPWKGFITFYGSCLSHKCRAILSPGHFFHTSAVLRMNSRYLVKITADKENCSFGVVPANRSNPARKITGAPKYQARAPVTRYTTRFTAAQGSCCQGLGGVLWIRRECQQLDDNPSTGVHRGPPPTVPTSESTVAAAPPKLRVPPQLLHSPLLSPSPDNPLSWETSIFFELVHLSWFETLKPSKQHSLNLSYLRP